MAIHMVSYDLNSPGKDYTELLKQIRTYTHCHALKSTFFIETNQSASAVRDHLMKYIDANDALYVTRLNGEWGANKKMPCTDWLQARNGRF
ncbi:hypothetical protein HWX16_23440 [Ochrobactrum intermedium]|uniref:hypothetical protein n=1 Tax=Brucella intermedia TaxID=94625 RepID=UPI00159C8493|nr:hypothetical protein [Brucella intermedia]NVM43237.1 hypothetical protein [Brucella intermedia]